MAAHWQLLFIVCSFAFFLTKKDNITYVPFISKWVTEAQVLWKSETSTIPDPDHRQNSKVGCCKCRNIDLTEIMENNLRRIICSENYSNNFFYWVHEWYRMLEKIVWWSKSILYTYVVYIKKIGNNVCFVASPQSRTHVSVAFVAKPSHNTKLMKTWLEYEQLLMSLSNIRTGSKRADLVMLLTRISIV